MSLHLYNSLSRRVEPFLPADPACPTLYVCGPTVYNYVHIGNARGPVVFGVLAALLRRRFGALRYARNITDVDDKINAAAAEQNVPIGTITERYADAYRDDMAMLGLTEPDYAWVTQQVKAVAEKYAQRRIVSVLEGGYELHALGRSALAHLKVLSGL